MKATKHKGYSLLWLAMLACACQSQAADNTKADAQAEETTSPAVAAATSPAAEASAGALPVDGAKSDIERIQVLSSRGLISFVSASASKSNVPVVETPVSVSVLTEKRITDLGAETLQDALGYVAGVYNGPYGMDSRGDWSQIRSVAPVSYLDGLQLLFGNYNNARPNPYLLQQVEILKGPSSVLFGQGSTGGIVNMVTKQPTAVRSNEIWAQLGNYQRKQLAGDFTGAFDEDANVLYRLTALVRDANSQTEHVADDAFFVAPSVSFYVTDNTRLTLLTYFQDNHTGSSTQFFPHEGTLLPAKYGQIPSERFVSEPGWDRYDTRQHSVTLKLEHEFESGLQLNWAARQMDSSAEYRTLYAWPPKFQDNKRELLRSVYLSDASASAFTTDLQLHGEFDTGALTHRVTVGADYQDVVTDNDSAYLSGQGGLIDVYQPVYGQISLPGDEVIRDNPSASQRQLGLYLQDSMRWNDWVLSLGLRHDSLDVKNTAGIKTSPSATTARAGLMYAFSGGISPYVSYSESFNPIAGVSKSGEVYKPREGQQWEGGIKYQPEGTEHLITLAGYRIVESNRVTQDTPDAMSQLGEVEIRGIELEAQLEWEHWDLYGSYAYSDSEIKVTDKLYEQGARLAAMPDNMLSVWATYRPDNWLPGLKMGLGYRYVGQTSDGSVDVLLPDGSYAHRALQTDSYQMWDMMLGYEWESWDLTLNVDNLRDRTVITSCLARGDCFYGQQRQITANVKYRF